MPRLIWFVAAAIAAWVPPGLAASHFWLTTHASGVAGPEAGSLGPTVGETVTLHLWGRPEPGRQFDAVSIDVVASAAGLDFVDGSYVFHNAIDGSTSRFEQTLDSASLDPMGLANPLESFFPPEDVFDYGEVDGLRGLRGFTVNESPSIRGPGPVCAAGEADCEVSGDGAPAWRLASFDVAAVTPGTVELYLQIGDRGIVERTLAPGDYDLGGEVAAADRTVWAADYGGPISPADGNGDGLIDAADYVVWRNHLGETSVLLTAADSDARFGVDGMGGDEPAHNASTDKQTNAPGDDPDFTFKISLPAMGVPEPTAGALGAAALLGLIRVRRPRPTREAQERIT